MKQTDPNTLVSARAAATLLGVSSSTIRLWTDAAKFTDFRTVGGHRRIKLAEVVAMQQNQTIPETQTAEGVAKRFGKATK